LLEFATDDQRTILMKNAAPNMVEIALNQHGTRALQKMIEYIHTPDQIDTIIRALDKEVVRLIKDLNGNHVIQKCLNHLKPEDAQFIFNAVGKNCYEVGTHRHGCCVLQRCIDHAAGDQKAILVQHITDVAVQLVQDPFGNYVVQYILDLHDQSFTQPLCHQFLGQVVKLSKQKFSSNVIEKCIRVADQDVKTKLIQELLQKGELEKVLRDSFANYVIQTALDHADDDTARAMIEGIRPNLATIRQTPYGRRIQSKVQEREGRLLSGANDPGIVNSPMNASLHGQSSPFNPIMSPTASPPGSNAYSNSSIASPTPHRYNNPLATHLQNTVQQPYPAFGRAPQANGFSYF
jgi:hypothetical protein